MTADHRRADYRDALYESYVSGHQGEIVESRSAAAFEADIVGRVPADRGLSILDVGCGQGQVIRLLESHGYGDVSGIDISAEQIELARRLGTRRAEVADLFVFAEAHEAAFDVVIAVDVVEHFDRGQVQEVFTALGRLLRPGGTLILRTPNGVSPYVGRILFGDLTHGLAYTSKSLEQAASQSGFSSVRAYPVRPAGGGVKQRVRRTLWRMIELALIMPLVIETGVLRGHIVTQNLVAVLRRGDDISRA